MSTPIIRLVGILLASGAISAPYPHAAHAQGSGGGAPVAPTTRVVDGVRVHSHGDNALLFAPKFALDPTPLAILGGADGDPNYDLTYARDAIVLSDGRIVTFSSFGGGYVFVWSANGRPQRSLGRHGQGPGEWTRPTGIARLNGDTIFVPDAANRRLNWLLADTGLVLDSLAGGVFAARAERLVGVLPGGRIVLSSTGRIPSTPPAGSTRSEAVIAVARIGGEPAAVVARIPDLDIIAHETRFRGTPRTATAVIGFSRSANLVVWDTLIASGSGDGYRIDVRNAAGEVVSSILLDTPRRAVSTAMRSAVIDAQLRRLEGPRGEGMMDPAESRRLIRENPFADSLPPYQRFHITQGKLLWVVDAVAPNDTTWSATAFRLDGAIVGRLSGPGPGAPIAFADDRVVVAATDADGVVSVRVHGIRR